MRNLINLKNLLMISVFLWGLSGSVLAADGNLPGSGDPNDPYIIEDLADFDAFASDTNYWTTGIHTKLMCDPNLSGMTYTTAVIAPDTDNQNYEFDGPSFAGIFDGNGHNIHKLTIDPNGASNHYLGLFGLVANTAVIKNLAVDDLSITGGNNSRSLGGLCGGNDNGNIINCNSTGSVTGGNYDVGGLCGSNSGNIINCYANSSVINAGSGAGVGGLCGSSWGNIINCYSIGSVTGSVYSMYVGGLCGLNNCNWRLFGTISNCYSTSSVSGGLEYIGGLLGDISGSINNSFWDIEIGGPDNGGGIPKTTLQMQDPNTFISVGWDFVGETTNGSDNYWRLCVDSVDYPKLAWQSITADIACPAGVNLSDFGYFAGRWMETGCYDSNHCGRVDMDLSTDVGLGDLLIFTQNWLAGTSP